MASLIAPFILLLVALSLIFRDFLRIPLSPWQLMLAGALLSLLFGQISPLEALNSIDVGVMLFLYGMLLLALFLQESWYLEHLGYKLLNRLGSPFFVLCTLVFAAGLASAFLLNDTVAIIGVPLCLLVAGRSRIRGDSLLVALALAVTIGGMASPIGSPQNYLIASQLSNPFSDFAHYLLVPTLLSLFFLACLLWLFFPELRRLRALSLDVSIRSRSFYAARTGLFLVFLLSVLRALLGFLGMPGFPLYWIALAGGGCALLLSRKWENALRVDWETLVFFAAMFVLMESVWLSGFFQQFLPAREGLLSPAAILAGSMVLSQFLSNVPFVILYLKALGAASATALAPAASPALAAASASATASAATAASATATAAATTAATSSNVYALMLLAAGSTLAGALTLLGAASNIIILQSAEKRGVRFPTREFMIIGLMSAIVSVLLILAWGAVVGGA